ncbi:MAG: hypothetical protein WAL80_00775 [Xanthobacteraceae bacterium]|jgi:hypothetical protein
MTKSLVLAAAALALSSAVALAQNAPVSAPAKSKQVAHHEKTMTAKPLYDYAPTHVSSYGNTPIIFGVAY